MAGPWLLGPDGQSRWHGGALIASPGGMAGPWLLGPDCCHLSAAVQYGGRPHTSDIPFHTRQPDTLVTAEHEAIEDRRTHGPRTNGRGEVLAKAVSAPDDGHYPEICPVTHETASLGCRGASELRRAAGIARKRLRLRHQPSTS